MGSRRDLGEGVWAVGGVVQVTSRAAACLYGIILSATTGDTPLSQSSVEGEWLYDWAAGTPPASRPNHSAELRAGPIIVLSCEQAQS